MNNVKGLCFTWIVALILISAFGLQAQSSVDQWGKTSAGTAWPITNTALTPAGNAGIGNGAKPTAWSTIAGGFDQTYQATTELAVVVSGQLQLVGGGGGSAYTHLRYALTYQDSVTLNYQYTDSARWVSTKKWYGYEFCPRTGTGTMANGAWGVGVAGPIVNGNWNSTNSNNGKAFSAVKQAPRNAEMIAGTYNWAISVQPLGDGTNEVRWYLVEQNNKYWFGGTAIDTAEASSKFNAINFGFNNDLEATQVNFTNVTVQLGAPIVVPEAPWQDFYVNQWGKTSAGTAWPILNDSTYLDGDAGIGNGAKPTAWSTIAGGWGDPIMATTEKAIIVSGQLELVGGGGASAYTHLRYALTYQDSSTLSYQNTDTARWVSTKKWYGYEFCPRTGTGTMANGAWGVGVAGPIVNGNWNSTNSNNGKAFSAVKQAPRNAEMIAGTYNWAISVQPLGDGTNEVRWYLVEKNNKYWFGGTAIDTAEASSKFNFIDFGFNNDLEATQVNLIAVKVSLGAPIVVPEAPWQDFFVNQWGKTSAGTAWPILNDSTYLDGDAGIGNGAKPTAWSTIAGGFGDPVTATTSKAIIVSGQLELVGGGGASAYTHLRYALTYQDSATLNYQNTDTATWVSTKKWYGYEFCPRTGTGTMANGAWGVGVAGPIVNGNWNSTNSNNGKAFSAVKQAPRNAEMIAGTYNWAISVQPLGDGTNEVRWYLVEKNNKYWFGGTAIDTAEASSKFNFIDFGFNNDLEATQVNLIAVKVSIGAPIVVPEAPWQDFYVNQWGKTSAGTAWPILNDSTYLDGDAGIGNGAKPTAWATIAGGFGDPVTATTSKAINVTGQLELVGGGGASAYTHLRYALTYQDSATLNHQNTDTATWVSTKKWYGYEFCPRTGTGTMANGAWGVGTVGPIVNGNWNSTNSNNGKAFSAAKQAPRNAVMIAGTYNFGISVKPVGDGTNEVRWYLVEKNNKYWFGGTEIDTVGASDKFNFIDFGFNNDLEATQVNLIAVKVNLGDPFSVPEAPWEPYFVTDWGFSGDNLGGWDLTAGEFDGDVTIGGSTGPTGFSAVRGGFDTYVLSTQEDRALKLTGKINLVGGGFEDIASLRFGVFYSDSAGSLIQDAGQDSNWVWNGTDAAHSGYLFAPPSGTNIASWSGTPGTWGGVDNDTWWDIDAGGNTPLSVAVQLPADAVAGAGTYDFAISVAPNLSGSGNIVKATLTKEGGGYYYEVSGNTPVTATSDMFNCIAFAIDNSTTTTMNLYEVEVDRGAHITTDVEAEKSIIPERFALRQNYPNPFNPSTTIEFALPEASDISLKVYDATGRVVAELAKGKYNAGFHKINFNAANIASGIYFYRLEANKFVDVKKFVLIK